MAFISNGTTILDNGAFQASLGSLVLISEQTASASSSISFTTGIDSTYPIYKFEFINIHPSIDNGIFKFNLSTDGGSNYNVVKTTTTAPIAQHTESGASSSLSYDTGEDLAQSTADQSFVSGIGDTGDQSASGYLYLYNPSSTTFVKHFMARINFYHPDNKSIDASVAGYGNTTSAINAVIFRMNSGNIDDGTIKLYGIKDS
jgi:hypothetical protein